MSLFTKRISEHEIVVLFGLQCLWIHQKKLVFLCCMSTTVPNCHFPAFLHVSLRHFVKTLFTACTLFPFPNKCLRSYDDINEADRVTRSAFLRFHGFSRVKHNYQQVWAAALSPSVRFISFLLLRQRLQFIKF